MKISEENYIIIPKTAESYKLYIKNIKPSEEDIINLINELKETGKIPQNAIVISQILDRFINLSPGELALLERELEDGEYWDELQNRDEYLSSPKNPKRR